MFQPPPSITLRQRNAARRPILCVLFPLAFSAALCIPTSAQSPTPGQDVNMVSGTKYPGGDPALQRQNEPSIAVSTRNPLHLLAAANDYRAVDLPVTDTLPNLDLMAGDAWLGIFKSFDGGQTWQSILHPGFPQDRSPVGSASPLKGLAAASDPVVRAGAAGFFGMTGIAFNRTQNQGVVFFTRFLDLNNKENGDPTNINNPTFGTDPIRFIDTHVIATGNAGQFLDKPWLAIDRPRGSATCALTVPGASNVPAIPAGNIYLAYSVFVGNTDVTIRTKLYLTRSVDCGNTWSTPVKLSETHPINQGAQIAIDPTTGYLYVAWREFASTNQLDAINIVKSTDGGVTFTKGLTIWSLPAFGATTENTSFFDEGTTGGSIRTNSFPAITVGNDGTVYVAWSQRNAPGSASPGSARIVYMSSSDGLTWPSTPTLLDDDQISVDSPYASFSPGTPLVAGHQFMPSLIFSQGKLIFLYYDQRLDHTLGFYTPNLTGGSISPDANGKFYGEQRNAVGASHGTDVAGDIFNSFLSDYTAATIFSPTPAYMNRRHTIEVRLTSIDVATNTKTSAFVSQYKFGRRNDAGDVSGELQQLEVNPPNLPLYKTGSMPFLGDYIEITAPSMFQDASGAWQWNSAPVSTPLVAYASWTTNQNVRPPADGNWASYTPPTFFNDDGTITSNFDPTQNRPACSAGHEGMRNQDIYSSRITEGLVVSSPQNTKPLSPTLQRGFVVLAQNYTDKSRSFRLSIVSQPPGGFASFTQGPNPVPVPVNTSFVTTTADVVVSAGSGVARTVFAASTTPLAPIVVNVQESMVDANGNFTGFVPNGLTTFVRLNSDPTSPQLVDADGASGISNVETYDSATIQNPNALNPNPLNPNPLNVTNPNPLNPNPLNPNPLNPNPLNPNPLNPNPLNPNPLNPDIADPNALNPNPLNPNPLNTDPTNQAVLNPNPLNPNPLNPNPLNTNLTNAPVSDGTYTVVNTGNTHAGYRLKLFSTSSHAASLQVIVSKTYVTPTSFDCQLSTTQQPVVLANAINATVDNISNLNPNPLNTAPGDTTFSLPPGGSALITIRGAGLACHSNGDPLDPQPNYNRCSDQPGASYIDDVIRSTVPVVFAQAADTNINTGGAPPSTVGISAPPFMATTALAPATFGAPYSANITVIGGVAPITITAAGLPTALAMSGTTTLNAVSTATISGTAQAIGRFPLNLTATGADGRSVSTTLVLIVSQTGGGGPTAGNLTFVVQPSNANASQAISPAVKVRALDNTGAVVAGAFIAIAIGNNAGGATLSGTTTQPTDATGIATFPDLTLDRGGLAYTLTATVAAGDGTLSTQSQPFTIFGFSTAASLSTARFVAQATALQDGRVLITGGLSGCTAQNTAVIYDPTRKTFSATTNNMATARANHQATLLKNGKVLITGGQTTCSLTGTVGAELYDPLSNAFTAIANMLAPRVGHTATMLTSGKVLLAGGYGAGTPTAELYDPTAGIFTATTGAMNNTRGGHTATLLADGTVLIAGGRLGLSTGTTDQTAQVYNPATDSFRTTLGPTLVGRELGTATLLGSGKVLLAGGTSNVGVFNSAELYDPSAGTFSSTGTMQVARDLHTATLLQSGEVLIAAGFPGTGPTAEAELYDPTAGTFSQTGSLSAARHGHTATLLADGTILIAGGLGVTTTEIYTQPPSTVHLTAVDTYILENGTTTNVTRDLSTGSFVALAPDGHGGYITFTGAGTANGTFDIPNVPAGYYYLRFTPPVPIFLWTNARNIDFGFNTFGRPNSVTATGGTVNFSLTNMSPWQSTDDVQIYAPNAGAALTNFEAGFEFGNPNPAPATGSTVYGGVINWTGLQLIDSTQGDNLYVLKMGSIAQGGFTWNFLQNLYTNSSIVQADDSTTSVAGTFSSPTQNATFRAAANGAAFSQAITGPSITIDNTSMGVYVSPPGPYTGIIGFNPALVGLDSVNNEQIAGNIDAGNIPYADPFPTNWQRLFSYEQSATQPFTAPGATSATLLLLESALGSQTMPSASAPASPIVGAIGPITINGLSLSTPQSGVGTTPTIAWQAAPGATNYRVRIWALTATETGGSNLRAVLILQTTSTSLQIPPGLLSAGTTYVAEIAAFNMPVDWKTAPQRFGLPLGLAKASSNTFTP